MSDSPLDATGIDHVVLHIRDLGRSKAFYVDLLGMTVEGESRGRARLRCGSQLLALFTAPEGDAFAPHGDIHHVALNVRRGTYDEIKGILEGAGYAVSGRPGDPHCIYCKDPDVNRVQIVVPDRA